MEEVSTYCRNYDKLMFAKTEQDLLRLIAENLIEINSKLDTIQRQILIKK